jgi:seryl-tRNA synthetase
VLDPKLIRGEPDLVRAALARRGDDGLLDAVLALDARRRELLPSSEALAAQRNAASRAIGAAKQAGEDAAAQLAEMEQLKIRARELDVELDGVEQHWRAALASLPNLPEEEAPLADTVVRVVGEPRVPADPPRDHVELAGPLLDLEAAARVSGARFAYLKGDLVMLELALVGFTLRLLRERGFEPVIPPVLVREQALFGTGFLPDTEQQLYKLADDDLYLVGTSEVPLASLHAGETLEESALPLRYAGFSPCFRREAGAAGRDQRGIFRVHQFDKVEMFSFVEPERSREEHERLLAIEEEILSALMIPYRVVDIAAGDLGSSAARKFDCEAWLPGQDAYRELTSCSNTTDYQARRLEIRARPPGGKPRHVHTLNGTAVAVGRTIIALLENSQDEAGRVYLPPVLVEHGAPAEIGPF